MDADTVLSGGRVVTPGGTIHADVVLAGERIEAVTTDSDSIDAATRLDVSGKLIFPGVVDPHVHIDGENDLLPAATERYDTGTRAAALGGVTTIIDFGWQDPDASGTTTVADGIKRKQSRAAGSAFVDYSFHGVVTTEQTHLSEELEHLQAMGIPSVKLFTAYEFGLSYGFLDSVFAELSDRGMVALVHAEDGSLCDRRAQLNRERGRGDIEGFLDSRPSTAEAMATDCGARLAIRNGCKYYQMHLSSAAAVAALRTHQSAAPALIRGETCNPYVAWTDSLFDEFGFLALHAPPVRTDNDRHAIIEALDSGVLSVLSTDHSAYSTAAKTGSNWWDIPLGNNTLQYAFPVLYDELVETQGLPPASLADLTSHTPARLFGLPSKGGIAPENSADLFVFDPTQTLEITAAQNASTADYSIYDGRTVTGAITDTFVRGHHVVADGRMTDTNPVGVFVSRRPPNWAESP